MSIPPRSADGVTHDIPPEGDEYNKQRETELFASITNKAALVRRHAEMLRDGAPLEHIAEAVSAMAQMERDIARISLELHNSTQGKNLNIFLMRFESALEENAVTMRQMIKEKSDADTIILAGVQNNLALYNTTLGEVLTSQRANETRLGEMQRLAVETARSLKKFQEDLEALRQGQTDYNVRLDAVITRLDTNEERLDRKRERIDALEADVSELRGPPMPADQRARYVAILLLMIAEWEAAHPDFTEKAPDGQ